MAKVRSISYERGFIPDNSQPEKELKKYENEKLGLVVDLDEGDTVRDAYKLAEITVLEQRRKIEDTRDARCSIIPLQQELKEINHHLEHIDENMMDEKKLRKRKVELEEIIQSVT